MIEEAFARFMIPVVAIVGGLLVALISVLANSWRLVSTAKANAELKQSLVDKGMNADDIVRVINAGAEGGKKC